MERKGMRSDFLGHSEPLKIRKQLSARQAFKLPVWVSGGPGTPRGAGAVESQLPGQILPPSHRKVNGNSSIDTTGTISSLARGCELGSTKLLAQGCLGAHWIWIIPAHPPATIPFLDSCLDIPLCWGWSHPWYHRYDAQESPPGPEGSLPHFGGRVGSSRPTTPLEFKTSKTPHGISGSQGVSQPLA